MLRALTVASMVTAVAGQCTVTNPTDQREYDLSSLTTSPYYQVQSAHYPSYWFYFNICGAINFAYDSVNNPGTCPEGETTACEVQDTDGRWEASEAYGKTAGGQLLWNTNDFPEGVTEPGPLYSTNGGTCERNGQQETITSKVWLVCDEDADTPVPVMIDDNYWDCYVKIILRTNQMCVQAPPGGQNGGVSEEEEDIGMILCVVFFVAVFVYIGGGMAYNIKVKGMDKYEAVPNKEFWQSMPGLISDGFEFTKNNVKAFIEKHRGGSSYAEL
eukprot:m.437246 g.437246  ORF g.437246 m.437246 type:complete len:272 (+) comp18087_c0_seq1:91-906(+)